MGKKKDKAAKVPPVSEPAPPTVDFSMNGNPFGLQLFQMMAAQMAGLPRTATERLQRTGTEQFVYAVAIDEDRGCGRDECTARDGVIVIVPKRVPSDSGPVVCLGAFNGHTSKTEVVALEVEPAKQLVNRISEAIAAAEQLAAPAVS